MNKPRYYIPPLDKYEGSRVRRFRLSGLSIKDYVSCKYSHRINSVASKLIQSIKREKHCVTVYE